MKKMRPTELSKFALASKRLLAVFQASQAVTLPHVLIQQPEFKTMLLLYTSTARDSEPGKMLYPRAVTFELEASNAGISPDAQKNVVLLEPSISGDPNFRHIRVQMDFMVKMWNLLKTVDWWVDVYPRIRWRDQREDRRGLRPDEEARLRKAIARWWLYAHYFHSNGRRDLYQPKKWADDKRLHHIRLMSTREICELEELWGAVYALTSHYLCSTEQQTAANVRSSFSSNSACYVILR